MTAATFSPITGYGPQPDLSTIGAAPTNVAPLVGSALPNAAVPTGYDANAYLPGSSGLMIPPPVTDMGYAGPVGGGGVVGTATPTGATGVTNSAWNAEYGDLFARAFLNAGVSPSVTSAALHTLAANAPSAQELNDTLQMLQTPEGIAAAPYMAEQLAKQAPGYASIVESEAGAPGSTTGTSSTDEPQSPEDLVGQYLDDGNGGQIQITGVDEQGGLVLEDGTILNADGTVTDSEGNTYDSEGNPIQTSGTPGKDGAPPKPGEIDPVTGLPVDPNAAEGESQTEQEGGSAWPWIVGGGGLVGAGLLYRHFRNKNKPDPVVDPVRDRPVTPTSPDGKITTAPDVKPGTDMSGAVKVQPTPDGIKNLPGGSGGGATPDPVTPKPAASTPLLNADGSPNLDAIHRRTGQAHEYRAMVTDHQEMARKFGDTFDSRQAAFKTTRELAPQVEAAQAKLNDLNEKIATRQMVTKPTKTYAATTHALEMERSRLLLGTEKTEGAQALSRRYTEALAKLDLHEASLKSLSPQLRTTSAHVKAGTLPGVAVADVLTGVSDDLAKNAANALTTAGRGVAQIISHT